jgi:hypothetical protein
MRAESGENGRVRRRESIGRPVLCSAKVRGWQALAGKR